MWVYVCVCASAKRYIVYGSSACVSSSPSIVTRTVSPLPFVEEPKADSVNAKTPGDSDDEATADMVPVLSQRRWLTKDDNKDELAKAASAQEPSSRPQSSGADILSQNDSDEVDACS